MKRSSCGMEFEADTAGEEGGRTESCWKCKI